MKPRILILALFPAVVLAGRNDKREEIIAAAKADGIDLNVLPIASAALDSIEAAYTPIPVPIAPNAKRIDVHGHAAPDWYRTIAPTAGGNPTPNWTLASQLQFMSDFSIGKSILSISTPGSVVYPGDAAKSAVLARLLNEYLAALTRTYPEHFGFWAVTPLPYVQAAVNETRYALRQLDAAGVGLLSNHEGYYLGNQAFSPYFTALNSSGLEKVVLLVHPTNPTLRGSDGRLASASPLSYPPGFFEFYFDTARTFMDLSISRTLVNYTKFNWVVPHVGGSFPSLIDRVFARQNNNTYSGLMKVYKTRLFWDSAGFTYAHQVLGLLGYDIPKSQLVFGTDCPYVPDTEHGPSSYAVSVQYIENATFLSDAERAALFRENAEKLLN